MSSLEFGAINISRIPVSGIGGLGLVVTVVIIAIALPPLQWFLMGALASGLLLGMVLIAWRRHRSTNPDGPPGVLFGSTAAARVMQVRAAETNVSGRKLHNGDRRPANQAFHPTAANALACGRG